jgi:hypothetical protein
MIRVYKLDKLLANVEMIDGKMHVIDYDDGYTTQFIEDLRPRQAELKAVLKAKREGIPLAPKSEWEPVSDQELYDSFYKHFGGHVWVERD